MAVFLLLSVKPVTKRPSQLKATRRYEYKKLWVAPGTAHPVFIRKRPVGFVCKTWTGLSEVVRGKRFL
jgi:hypothetical protein